MLDRPDNPNHTVTLTWADVERVIDLLVPQIRALGGFNTLVLVTRGGVIPGGMLAEALDVQNVLTAAVDFPSKAAGLMAWPQFMQFPDEGFVAGQRVLVVDDVWGTGRTSIAVRERLNAAHAEPFNCVLHYNPYRSLFKKQKPDFFGETTDAYIVYPWERNRGLRDLELLMPDAN